MSIRIGRLCIVRDREFRGFLFQSHPCDWLVWEFNISQILVSFLAKD